MKLLILFTLLLTSSAQAATYTYQSFIQVRGESDPDRFVVRTTIDDQAPIAPLNPMNPSVYISTVLTKVTITPFRQNKNIWPGIGDFAEFTQNPETLFIPLSNMFSSIENNTHRFHEVLFVFEPTIGFPVESTFIFADLLNGSNLEDLTLEVQGSIRNIGSDKNEFIFDVYPVPLPATFWLMLSGFVVLGRKAFKAKKN